MTASDVLYAAEGHPDATVVGDLTTGAGIPEAAYDCFICTQTLQFIYDIRAAVSGTSARCWHPVGCCSRRSQGSARSAVRTSATGATGGASRPARQSGCSPMSTAKSTSGSPARQRAGGRRLPVRARRRRSGIERVGVHRSRFPPGDDGARGSPRPTVRALTRHPHALQARAGYARPVQIAVSVGARAGSPTWGRCLKRCGPRGSSPSSSRAVWRRAGTGSQRRAGGDHLGCPGLRRGRRRRRARLVRGAAGRLGRPLPTTEGASAARSACASRSAAAVADRRAARRPRRRHGGHSFHGGNVSFRTEALRGVEGFWPAQGQTGAARLVLRRALCSARTDCRRVEPCVCARQAPRCASSTLSGCAGATCSCCRARYGARSALIGERRPRATAARVAASSAAGTAVAAVRGDVVRATERVARAAENARRARRPAHRPPRAAAHGHADALPPLGPRPQPLIAPQACCAAPQRGRWSCSTTASTSGPAP